LLLPMSDEFKKKNGKKQTVEGFYNSTYVVNYQYLISNVSDGNLGSWWQLVVLEKAYESHAGESLSSMTILV